MYWNVFVVTHAYYVVATDNIECKWLVVSGGEANDSVTASGEYKAGRGPLGSLKCECGVICVDYVF